MASCGSCSSLDPEPITGQGIFCMAFNRFVQAEECCGCWVERRGEGTLGTVRDNQLAQQSNKGL